MKNSFTTFPIFRLAAALLLLAGAISCSKDNYDIGGVDTPTVPKVSLDIPSDARVIDDVLLLNIGNTLELAATVEPQNSFDQQVDWSSDDSGIATVDTTGLVSGIADGIATITATSQENPELSNTVRVRVAQANTILAFRLQGLETVQPTITDTEVIFEIDFNTEGSALDVAELITVVDHNGASVRSLQELPSSSTAPTATITQDFRGKAIPYTVTGEDGEERTYQVSVQTKPGTEFITTWNEEDIVIPTDPDFTYNYNIDTNNDGFIDETGITENAPVNFISDARTLRISGQFPAIFFNFGSEDEKIESLDQWGTVVWDSMENAFLGCSNLRVPATDVPDLSKVTTMLSMFRFATIANPDVSNWDTRNVTNMFATFNEATSANPDVSRWNTSSVTTMKLMFFNATSAEPDVSGWDTRNVNDMSSMFSGATSANPDVSQWNTGEVTDMGSMFRDATQANPDVIEWNTSKVTNMAFMFRDATQANPNVSGWNISGIEPGFNVGLSGVFRNSGLSIGNYNKALIRFAEHAADPNNEGLSLPQNIDLGSVPVAFCSNAATQSKATLEANGWTGIGNQAFNCITLP